MNKLTQNDCRFVYFHKNSSVITCAYRIMNYGEKTGCHHVIYSYATQSLKDRFVKKFGRDLAIERLNSGLFENNEKKFHSFEISDDPDVGIYKQITNAIDSQLFQCGKYSKPHWMKRSVTIASEPLCEAFQAADALSKEDRNFLRKYLNSLK